MTYKPEKGSRQPVVLYDQDNKAIDVSGIEELSSVKIDTGKIAGDLKLVKDNQGRLYGKYGEDWIPVKVDSEGRPILAGTIKELYSMNIADRPAFETITEPTSFTLLNATLDTWVSDGSSDWVEV